MEKINYKKCFEKPGNIVGIFGKSGSGKTTTLKHLIQETEDIFTHIFIYQGSEPAEDNLYIDIAWPDDIYVLNNDGESKKNAIESIKKEMDDIINHVTKINLEIEDGNKKNPNNKKKLMHILFIFDDLTKESNKFNDYLGKLRHSPVTMILLLHSSTNIDKTFRSAITLFIIHVNFELNQLADSVPELKDRFGQLRKNKNGNDRLFLVYNAERCVSYFSLVEEENMKRLLETPYTVFNRHSKQRDYLIKYLKDLAIEGLAKN